MKRFLFLLGVIIGLTAGYEQTDAQGVWTQKADFGGTARSNAIAFSIGTKGYIGTTGNPSNGPNDFWEYDQANNSWTQKASFGGGVLGSAAGFSIGTKGYVGTGANAALTKIFWEYDQTSNMWSQKANFSGTARYYAIGFSIGSKGYIGTGCDDVIIVNKGKKDFWEYDPSSNSWTQKANFGGTARQGAIGFSIGTKGYIGTGRDTTSSNYYTNDFWEYDQSSNTWAQKANFGGAGRFGAVGFSIGTKGYIGTGRNGSNYYKDFWEWDQSTNTWAQKANFGGAGRYYSAGFSIGTRGYIGTGNDGVTPPYNCRRDFWEWCNINATIISSGSTTFCQGDSVMLTASNGNTYLWNNASTTQSIIATTPGNYFVTITNTDGCSISSPTTIVTVNPLPAVPVITQNNADLSSSAPTNNQWYFNGNIISGATAQIYAVTQNGSYYVCTTNSYGCSSCSATINITNAAMTESNSSPYLSIYPNPFSSSTTLRTDIDLKNATLTIYNCFGQKVKQTDQLSGKMITLQRDDLPSGLYFIRIHQDNDMFLTDKILILDN